MATFAQVRDQIPEVLAGIDGLTVFPKMPGSSPVLPAVVVRPGPVLYASRESGRGQDVYRLDLIVLVSGADPEIAQVELDDLIDVLRARFKTDRHLGLSDATAAWIDGMDEYANEYGDAQETPAISAVLQLIIRTSG